MSFQVNKDFNKDCSRNHETCELTAGLFADDEFYSVASIEDPDETMRHQAFTCRKVIAGLLELCVEGDCPGQKPALFEELARRRREA